MTKKKISILILSLGAGGAEKVVSLLLPKLLNDYNVSLVLFSNIIHFEIPDGVKVLILDRSNNSNKLFKIFGFFNILYKYLNFLRKESIDISLSLLTRPNFINVLSKFINNKTKFIISERCYPSIAYKSNVFRYKLYKFLIPLLYNKADVLFSNSIHINRDLRDNFCVDIPMKVIYNPIDIPNLKSIYDLPEKTIDIIWVGKLNSIKNPNLLVNSLMLSQIKPRVTFLGEGLLSDNLKYISRNLDVKFEGKVNNVAHFLNLSKVLVLTSNSEGFPNVILEGMSYGLPIISTNCQSGPLELLNENEEVNILPNDFFIAKYGILINVNDEIALSKAIDELLKNSELYHKLRNASHERSKMYSTSEIYNNLSKLIQS